MWKAEKICQGNVFTLLAVQNRHRSPAEEFWGTGWDTPSCPQPKDKRTVASVHQVFLSPVEIVSITIGSCPVPLLALFVLRLYPPTTTDPCIRRGKLWDAINTTPTVSDTPIRPQEPPATIFLPPYLHNPGYQSPLLPYCVGRMQVVGDVESVQ